MNAEILTYAIGALWVVTMALAGAWGKRIDRRLASIDTHLTAAARFEGAVGARLDAHQQRLDRIEHDLNSAIAR